MEDESTLNALLRLSINRGSNMTAPVLLYLLNELGKKITFDTG